MAKIKLEDLTYKNHVGDTSLMSEVAHKVERAASWMKQTYHSRWEKYRLLWATEFKETLRTRNSERCKLITPTTQIGVDTGTAQLDSSLGYLSFIEVDPDVPEEGIEAWRETYAELWDNMVSAFRNDLANNGNREEISDAIFNAGLLGLGVLKVVEEEEEYQELSPGPQGGGAVSITKRRTNITLRSVDPRNFHFPKGAVGVEDSPYVVEEMKVPAHTIEERIRLGVYSPVEYTADEDSMVTLYEYHGVLSKAILDSTMYTSMPDELVVRELNEDKMVEAIVVWAKGAKAPFFADETPFLDKKRSYLTFVWDREQGSPVGRGIAAKVFSVQKAQDANLRARTDAMAYAVHPMVGVDNLKLVSRRRMKVSPGAQILTQGDPNRAIVPFRFGDIPQSAFLQAQELASLAAQSTGLDAFGGTDVKYQSGEGMQTLQQGTVARSRKVQENMVAFLKEAINLFLWRSTQADPERYPPVAPGFKVTINVGSLTRAHEMSQISGMLKTIPEQSPAYWRLLIKYFELSDLPDKEQVISDMRKLAEASLNPPPPQPTYQEQLLERKMALEEMREKASIQLQAARVRAELVRAAASIEKIDVDEMKAKADAILSLAKAEAAEVGSQLDKYKALVEGMSNEASLTTGDRLTGLGTGGGAPGDGLTVSMPVPGVGDTPEEA